MVGPDGGAALGRPMLTLTEAADAAGVHRDTIRRRFRAGEFPGAVKTQGVWRIPAGELLAAGFRLHAPDAPGVPPGGDTPPPAPIGALEAAEARIRELEAIVRGKDEALEMARLALRALPPGDTPTRRRWFGSRRSS